MTSASLTVTFTMHRVLPRMIFGIGLLLTAFAASDAQTPRVYRDRIEPHWFADNTKFWYRNELAEQRREFILVDTVSGTRRPAFDHVRVAAVISSSTGGEHSAGRLPVNSLEFSDDLTQVTLTGKQGRWTIDLSAYRITASEPNDRPRRVPLFITPRKSVDRGGDVHLQIKNEFENDIQLIWINREGQRTSYGSIRSGATRVQHTFVGHVWLLLSNDGKPLACFEAAAGTGEIVVNADTIQEAKDPQPPRSRRNRRFDRKSPAVSPDGKLSAYVEAHNLHVRPADQSEASQSVALTVDADARATFQKDASRARLVNMQYGLADHADSVPDVRWSPDSRYLLAFQTTGVPEPRVRYLESSPKDSLQPALHSYPYAKPGDPLPIPTPRLFCVDTGTEVDISTDLFPRPFELVFLKWSDDSSRFWLRYNERGHQNLRVLEVSAADGAVRAVVDEHSNTFIHYSTSGKNVLEWLPEDQLLWASERTGWNHLYRYDLSDGRVLNAVTSGAWNVRRIRKIDRQKKLVWFYAVGIADGQDPYHEHFCRVDFDGRHFRRLTEGDGTHEITFSPDEKFFVDRYSRVDLPPVTELRRTSDGSLVTALERADASEVVAARGSLPKRFHAKGRDGETDIWGIIHVPRYFDPSQQYPVIENIYAGPHDYHVPKAFRSAYRHQHQIADRGAVVVQIDGMGTAWRSKKFHDVCHKNLKDAGFPDRIAWMQAAADRFPWMDISRVGVYGGSAGGQNAMAALLWHGTFYKAAVADCGCHDNRMDKLWWNEQWMGWPVDDSYIASSNMENAWRLQGQLMLVVGEMDRNVDPASTTQVVKKLIDANKEFEFLLLPGAGHGACESPYGSRRRADFLAKHLRVNAHTRERVPVTQD